MDIAEFYNKRCQKPQKSWEICHWSSRESQRVNFDLLLKLISPSEKKETILDVGCGQGDLFPLVKNTKFLKYEGIDVSTNMVFNAKRRFPDGMFRVADMEKLDGKWDWIVASGTFNHVGQDIHAAIKKMFSMANKGIGLTILSKYDPASNKNPCDYLQPHDPAKVLETAFSLTRFVNMNHTALDWGFVLFMYQEDYILGS